MKEGDEMFDELKQYRLEIDAIDEQLYQLYKKRLNISRAIGLFKAEHKIPVFDAKREEEIKLDIKTKYETDIDYQAYIHLQEAMMRVSRNAQYHYTIGENIEGEPFKFEGLVGYQETACDSVLDFMSKMHETIQLTPFETAEKLAVAIANGDIAYGVIPFDLSVQVEKVVNLLCKYDLFVGGEILNQLECSLEKQKCFIIVSKRLLFSSKSKKTSLVLTLDHESCNLENVIAQFQYASIRISKIFSYDAEVGSKQSKIYIEFDGCFYSDNAQHLIQKLKSEVEKVNILGSYTSCKFS